MKGERGCDERQLSAKRGRLLQFFLGLAFLSGRGPVANAADQTRADEWRSYGHDYTEQRYSPLDAVNSETIKHLGLQWSLDLPDETALVSTPLYVNETLYFTGNFSVVYAVDAKLGRLKWTYDPKTREALARHHSRQTFNMGASRGLAYWDNKLFIAPTDGRLIALSAQTGAVLWSAQTFDIKTPRTSTGAPLAFNGKVLIGHGGGDTGPMRGYVSAYDAQTGKQLWRFFTVPGNPKDGFENEAMKSAAQTWTGEWWKLGGGGAVWNAMTFDPEFNRVYIGTGNGAPWNHALRSPLGGDNLYIASIVALDADSGQYVWHYQETPADDWDFDATEDMVLADLTVDGKARKALMQASKNGFFYVIDRSTGKLISAKPFVNTTWAKSVETTTGRPVEEPGARPQAGMLGVIIRPAAGGAHSWTSMSYNPGMALAYVPTLESSQYFSARDIDPGHWVPVPFTGWTAYSDLSRREVEESRRNGMDIGHAIKSSAWLQARDPRTNSIVWRVLQPGQWAGGTLTTRGRSGVHRSGGWQPCGL